MRISLTRSYYFQIPLIIGLFIICSCSDKIVDSVTIPIEEVTTTSNEIHARIWPSSGDAFVFPEDKLKLQKTGICMSGGGTRAMVCAVGQLRALADLGLMDDVGYISCVSGGSWASVPYTYYTSGAKNDNELLGTIIPPAKLTLSGMSKLTTGFLAGAANADLRDALLKNHKDGVPADEIWIKGVKDSYMLPFGVYDPESPRYLSYDTSTVLEIIKRNPTFSLPDFLTVRNKPGDFHRPYLVVNSSISGPYDLAPFANPEQLVVFNYTPLGIGSAKLLNPLYVTKRNKANNNLPVGAGFIEPFAFGATASTIQRGDCVSWQAGDGICLTLTKPAKAYTISDASGTSSAAFVAEFTGIGVPSLKDMSPSEQYWPIPTSSSLVADRDFMFGDGGNLENMGVITLLQRKVKKLVVFVNTSTPLNADYDTIAQRLPTKADMDYDVLTLFGIFSGSKTENMVGNQVFDALAAKDLMTQFVRAKSQGKSVIATTALTTVSNPWYGILPGETIQLTWVYNEGATEYTDSLNTDIQDDIGRGDFGSFAHFPHYSTIDQNLLKLVQLTPKQINLLYQFSAWTVAQNPEKFAFLAE
jgi:hypothetical protein